jgi:hypothetical protein
MPFYDDFDLSTVDVLLISQYVSVRFALQSQYRVGGNWAHHCSRTTSSAKYHAISILYISINGILFASSPLDFDDVPIPVAHM